MILSPEGFLEHAVSENVYAGVAMARRAMYQYGTILTPGTEAPSEMNAYFPQYRGLWLAENC